MKRDYAPGRGPMRGVVAAYVISAAAVIIVAAMVAVSKVVGS